MSGPQAGNPGFPGDYFAKRFARRGDAVRKYREVAEELHKSLISDIRSGRKRAALIHFRPFADYCLNCLFLAYAATEVELVRQKLPKNLVQDAKRIIGQWGIPVDNKDIKKLEKTYGDLSQAVHGSRGAVKGFEPLRADLIPSVQRWAEMLLQWVEEADRRLNGHRGDL